MRLSLKGAALGLGLLWALAVGLTAAAGQLWPGYGDAFLDVVRSVYPGYGATTGWAGVVVGTGYALVDGAVAGAVYAWLYNRFAG